MLLLGKFILVAIIKENNFMMHDLVMFSIALVIAFLLCLLAMVYYVLIEKVAQLWKF